MAKRFVVNRDKNNDWVGELLSRISYETQNWLKVDYNWKSDLVERYLKVTQSDFDDYILISITCPLDYDQFSVLISILDPIVAEYDPYAYFDRESRSTIVCSVRRSTESSKPDFLAKAKIIDIASDIVAPELMDMSSDIMDITQVSIDKVQDSIYRVYLEFSGYVYETSCYVDIDPDLVSNEQEFSQILVDQAVPQCMENLQTK